MRGHIWIHSFMIRRLSSFLVSCDGKQIVALWISRYSVSTYFRLEFLEPSVIFWTLVEREREEWGSEEG